MQINIRYTSSKFGYCAQTFDLYILSAKKVLKNSDKERKTRYQYKKNTYTLVASHTFFE